MVVTSATVTHRRDKGYMMYLISLNNTSSLASDFPELMSRQHRNLCFSHIEALSDLHTDVGDVLSVSCCR